MQNLDSVKLEHRIIKFAFGGHSIYLFCQNLDMAIAIAISLGLVMFSELKKLIQWNMLF